MSSIILRKSILQEVIYFERENANYFDTTAWAYQNHAGFSCAIVFAYGDDFKDKLLTLFVVVCNCFIWL